MKKTLKNIVKSLIVFLLSINIFGLCGCVDVDVDAVINDLNKVIEAEMASEAEDESDVLNDLSTAEVSIVQGYTKSDLENLKNIENFKNSTIEHIFLGTINNQGNATGYHYDMVEDSPGQIIDGTKSENDKNGCYSAKVMVNDVKKMSNNGYSTFFPDTMSPQQVIDAINEAYENCELVPGTDNIYMGLTHDGIEISLYLDGKGRITSAFPRIKKEKK